MVTKKPFLSSAEAHAFKSRLYENLKHGKQTGFSYIFGPGILSSPEQVREHNTFMKTAFPDLLEKLRMHFESELKTHCYYADELCFPGFNIFRLSPNTERPLWFHYDDARSILEKNYPQFGVRSSDIRQIEGGSRQLTFTCLLDAPKGLTAGLLYFPQQAQGLKVMSVEEARHGEFEKMASFHKYDLGEMNIFERLVHSVYGKNDSAVDVDRVTVQGYIVETNKGFVLFR